MDPLEFFENENFDTRASKIWIWTYKIIPDLWFVDLFWPIKQKFHTPPYCRRVEQQLYCTVPLGPMDPDPGDRNNTIINISKVADECCPVIYCIEGYTKNSLILVFKINFQNREINSCALVIICRSGSWSERIRITGDILDPDSVGA